jgi:hypothetical protein
MRSHCLPSCLCVHCFQHFNQWNDFQEIWYGHYEIELQIHELVRQHIKKMYSNRSLKNIQLLRQYFVEWRTIWQLDKNLTFTLTVITNGPLELFIYLLVFMAYLTVQSTAQSIQYQMVGWLVNGESERMWKEVVVPNLRYHLPRGHEENKRNSVTRASPWAEISWDLPNTKQCYPLNHNIHSLEFRIWKSELRWIISISTNSAKLWCYTWQISGK